MRPVQARLPVLPYRKPTEGRDYWVFDDVLADPDGLRARCLDRTDWLEGYPRRAESWPGMRIQPALDGGELEQVERLVKQATGAAKLWVPEVQGDAFISHNCVQAVGHDECHPRPHTDSRTSCRYAAVLYLNPNVPESCGTAFYRQRLPQGGRGGNMVMPPHNNLVDALGTRFVAGDAFVEDIRIPHRYNRLLLYRANMIHSATGYWGSTLEDKRMAAVFFWMA